MSDLIPPGFIFYAGALLLALAPSAAARRAVYLLTPIVAGAQVLALEPGMSLTATLFSFRIELLAVDRLSLLFAYLFSIAALLAVVFSLHLRDRVQQVAGLVYAGTALGAVLAGDLATLFVHWELLTVSSAFLVFARRTSEAVRAGIRYLVYQVLSGVLLLAGAVVLWQQTGSLAFGPLALDGPGPWLLFLAFGIKAGFPLLHTWLTDAYPEATPTGTVFLSALTTKVAVYCLARAFAGAEPLIYIGAVMACFPMFYAVIENDLRRALSYSIINQVGFMVCGIGIGTALAVNGAVAHAFTDVIFKGLLLMAMGAVMTQTGRVKCSQLGGLYRSMPQTAAACIVGAASYSAVPLFSGFVSKSMVMVAALHTQHWWVWTALLFASACALQYVGIKVPFFAFFSHDAGLRPREAPLNMRLAMFAAAALCIGIGCYPQALYALLPQPMDYTPYDTTHVVAQLQLLGFSALAFAWLKLSGLYPPQLPSVNIDAEWLYRRGAPLMVRWCERAGARVGVAVVQPVAGVLRTGWQLLLALTQPAPVRGPAMYTGGMVLVVIGVFAVWLLGYFL